MEDILKEIIEIDKNAREIVKQEKDKKINIDDFIETEFRTKKAILDLEYKEEITKQKENYDKLFQKRKMEIDSQIHLKITEIERSYKNKEKDIIKNIIDIGGGKIFLNFCCHLLKYLLFKGIFKWILKKLWRLSHTDSHFC